MDLLTPKLESFVDNNSQNLLSDNKDHVDDNEEQIKETKPLLSDELGAHATPPSEINPASGQRRRQQCSKCPMNYSKREYLHKHMLKVHHEKLVKQGPGRRPRFTATNDDPLPYKCDQCVKEYAKLKHLTRHKRAHLHQYCEQCQRHFSNFAEHMLKEHGVELPRPFECDLCKKTYRTKSNIQSHMRIHKAENRTYRCTVCPKAFFYGTDLRKHLKSHSQDRSVICDICGDSFKSADTLKCHVRRHTGERPYQCTQCPRAFTTSNSLEIHKRTHTGEKPYQCDMCDRRFSDSSTLLVHKRLHTGENPYCCHLCGRRTKQASNLRSHYKHFHKNNDITGRQIRLNSRIFSRFTQAEIDFHLNQSGDLMAILEQGLQDYNREQNEKYSRTEKTLETTQMATAKTKPKQIKKETTTASIGQDELKQEPLPMPKVKVRKQKNQKLKSSNAPKILNNFSEIKSEILQLMECTQLADQVESILPIENLPIPAPKPFIANHNYRPENMESVFIEDPACQMPPPTPAAAYDPNVEIKKEEGDDYDGWMNNVGYFDNNINDNYDSKNEFVWTTEPTQFLKCEWQPEYEDAADNVNVVLPPELNIHSTQIAEGSTESKPTSELKSQTVKKVVAVKKPKAKNAVKSEKATAKESTLSGKCPWCRKKFQDLRRHMIENHSDIERPFECFVCRKNYKRVEHLRFHQRTHWNERNIICHFCGEGYLLNSDLKKHIFNRHQNIRPYKCEECAKCFKNRHALQVHMRVHSGLKPFTCAVCAESFSAMSSLRIHERRHTGEKPYICQYCNASFADCSTHRQHVRIHTGEKPYICHLCGRRTAQAGNLKSHYRHYHKLVVKSVSMFAEPADQSQ